MFKGLLASAAAVAFCPHVAYATLPVQNTVTTGSLNSNQHFDRIITIGAPISRSNHDKYVSLGGMLWGSWEMLNQWVNVNKGGIIVGTERWGIEIVEVEDYSNATMARYAADQLVGVTSQYDVDFMFGPYSSSLTAPVLNVTETNAMVLLSAGSNQPAVWNGDVQYGYGLLYPGGGYFLDSMPLYKAKGAQTVAFICNTAASANSCNSISESDLSTQMTSIGMALTHYYSVNSDSPSYMIDLSNDLVQLAAEDVDVLILADYYAVCVDALSLAVEMDWTPKGTYLSVCNNDANAVAAMGSNAWYAGTYSAWASQSTYVSGISGMSVQQFTTEFIAEFHREPTYQAAAAFAAGEVLVSAIETQATINASLCTDSPTLAALMASGSYSTILAQPDITFDSNHQAVGEWVTLQYGNTGAAMDLTVVSSASPMVYPQPPWSSRVGIININDDSSNTCASQSDLAVTGTMCFLGGIAVACIVLIFVFPKFLKQQHHGMDPVIEKPPTVMTETGTAAVVGMEMNKMAENATETKNAMHMEENNL